MLAPFFQLSLCWGCTISCVGGALSLSAAPFPSRVLFAEKQNAPQLLQAPCSLPPKRVRVRAGRRVPTPATQSGTVRSLAGESKALVPHHMSVRPSFWCGQERGRTNA